MHMVIRLSTASQRAFRERKEKYVADLQSQLHELELKYIQGPWWFLSEGRRGCY